MGGESWPLQTLLLPLLPLRRLSLRRLLPLAFPLDQREEGVLFALLAISGLVAAFADADAADFAAPLSSASS